MVTSTLLVKTNGDTLNFYQWEDISLNQISFSFFKKVVAYGLIKKTPQEIFLGEKIKAIGRIYIVWLYPCKDREAD